jgi:hypothetical protein
MRAKAILIPTLLVGAMTCAYAQDGPGGRLGGGGGGGGPSIAAPGAGGPGGGGGGAAFDRGPRGGGGGDGPGGAPSARGDSGGDGPRGLSADGPPSRASRGDDAGERPSRSANEGPSDRGASRKSADSDRGDDGGKSRAQRSADDDRGGSAKKAAERAKPDKAAERAKSKTEDKADDSQKRATTETKDRSKDNAKEARESTPKADDTSKKGSDSARVAPERAKDVKIASDKRDRVGAAFRDRHDVKHLTKVEINIGVGRRLPREWDYYPVPIAVIDLVPEYRDYDYVWVDDEYVIVDPDSYEVVAVIPASSGGYASAGGGREPCSTRIRLSADERDLILHSVRMRDTVEVQDLDIGWSVPANIELQTFPEPVLAEAEELSGCRYFVAEDQLAIVDPEADKVVLLIDRS